ncbi:MAG: RNA polymerase sigma factor [Polyangiaceae bacterium]
MPNSREILTFAALFEGQARFVWRVLARLGIPEADLPDVSQEVFLSAHRMLPTFEQRCAVTTWLYGICLRVASTHRRSLFRRREHLTAEPSKDIASSLSPIAEVAVHRERLERVLSTLPEEQANVFVLYELEELTMSEVAAALGYPLQTAYSRLHAARKAVLFAFGERKRNSDP